MLRSARPRRQRRFLASLFLVVAACAAPPVETASPDPTSTPAPFISPSATPVAAEEGVYLAIGDSLTFGIGVPRPQEQGYAALVARALRGGIAPIGETRVFAVPGETATGFLERRLDDVLRAVDRFGPRVEVVTIGLGANELLRTRRDPACAEDRASAACASAVDAAITAASESLDLIVASVQTALADAAADARILVLAYYNPDPDPLATGTIVGSDGVVGCGDPEPGLNDRIACVADARGAELVDLHAAFDGRELELTRFADGDVHPNAAGYEVIADAILAVLETGGG